jgi:hypothetical protein
VGKNIIIGAPNIGKSSSNILKADDKTFNKNFAGFGDYN